MPQILITLGVLLIFATGILLVRSAGQPRSVPRRFSGLILLAIAIAAAALIAFLPDPYARNVTPAEEALRLAGPWRLGQEVAAALDRKPARIVVIAAPEDLKPGAYGSSNLQALQEGAGGPQAHSWAVYSVADLNRLAGEPRQPGSDPEILKDRPRAAALPRLLQLKPRPDAIVLLSGLPPQEELEGLEEFGLDRDAALWPPLYALESPGGAAVNLMRDGILRAIVHFQFSDHGFDPRSPLDVEAAARLAWRVAAPRPNP
ncbi:MAG: hypothetical protein RL095_3484 [Verrucomicrobiota bacterium]|jgi:hypothetical protein